MKGITRLASQTVDMITFPWRAVLCWTIQAYSSAFCILADAGAQVIALVYHVALVLAWGPQKLESLEKELKSMSAVVSSLEQQLEDEKSRNARVTEVLEKALQQRRILKNRVHELLSEVNALEVARDVAELNESKASKAHQSAELELLRVNLLLKTVERTNGKKTCQEKDLPKSASTDELDDSSETTETLNMPQKGDAFQSPIIEVHDFKDRHVFRGWLLAYSLLCSMTAACVVGSSSSFSSVQSNPAISGLAVVTVLSPLATAKTVKQPAWKPLLILCMSWTALGYLSSIVLFEGHL